MTRQLESAPSWAGWRPIERQLANILIGHSSVASSEVWVTLALLCVVAENGDVCIDLSATAGQELGSVLASAGRESSEGTVLGVRLPAFADWRKSLLDSGLAAEPGGGTPLILSGNRLYLSRYFDHEQALARRVRERLRAVRQESDSALVRANLERWFDGTSAIASKAAAVAIAKRFCVITGGPGTGKTSTVVRLLGILQDLKEGSGGQGLKACLVAPTGKAASRLTESIEAAKTRLAGLSDSVGRLPSAASTVHRALSDCHRLPDGSRAPLMVDLVLVDEASMLDLATMRRLMDASVNVERFVVLGDPHQLASVEAGAVLSEICTAACRARAAEAAGSDEAVAAGTAAPSGPSQSGLSAHLIELVESHRFRPDGGIGLLAARINRGDVEGTWAVLGGADPEVNFIELSQPGLDAVERLARRGYAPFWQAASPSEALLHLERFRILCAHRKGRFGVETWSARLARHAESQQKALRCRFEPILVRANSVDSPLRNGDLGVIWRESVGTRAWFGLAGNQTVDYALSRLPVHETAYAMSIHKSQGSEMDEIVVLLPDADSPLLTRELLYTAVTRARRRCTLVGTRQALRTAVERTVSRRSGLAEAICRVEHGPGSEPEFRR